jgi:putative thioredoxin
MSHEVRNFQTDVLERSKTIPVLVDFWAEWCGPCRVLGPVLERLAEQNSERWVLAKLDTEEFPDVAMQYGIRSIPNVKLFVDGEAVNEFVGALPEPAIQEWLKKAIPAKQNPAVEEARAILADLRFEEARELLEPVVGAEPDNQKARVYLSKAIFFSDPDRARMLVDGIEADSECYDLAEAIRVLHSLKGKTPEELPEAPSRDTYASAAKATLERQFDTALQKFIQVIRDDRYFDDDGSRKAGIAIFKYLGEDHPTTQKWRKEFNRSLFS